jgi:hypothetical protein
MRPLAGLSTGAWVMKKYFLLVFLILAILAPSLALAQDNPCGTAAGTYTIYSGAPYTATWLVEPTTTVSASDPTVVPARYDGFYVQVDTQPRSKVTPVAGAPCPAGNNQTGMIPYVLRVASGVSKGAHTFTVTAFNYLLDANGAPTAIEQESAAVSVPFAAVDPVALGPPKPIRNAIIKR